MKPTPFLRRFLAIAGSAALTISYAHAAVRYWDGTTTTADADGGNGTWQTANAWDTLATAGVNATFVSGTDTAVFGGVAGTVSLNADLTNAGALLFNTSGYTIQSNDLTVRTLTLNTATSQFYDTTFASTVNIALATGTHTIGLTGTSTINGVLSGAQALTTGGGGTLVLANTANTFSGKLSLNQGTVEFKTIANVNGGASSLGNVTTIANGTIDLGNASNQDASLLYSGTGNSSTDRVINLGTAASNRTATIEVAGTGNLTFTSAFTVFNAQKTLNLQGSSSGVGEIANAIPNIANGLTVTKNGTGKWIFSGSAANAYAGLTTVSGGTLELSKSGTANAIAGGGLTIGGANNTAATVKYTGASSDMMGAGAVTINGRGILDFNGKSDTIGNVSIVSTGATGTDPTPIINSTAGGNLTIGSLTLTPQAGLTSVVNAGTGTITLGGNVTFNAASTGRAQISGTALALGANRTFTVGLGGGATQDLLIDAQITGAFSLTKAGLGRLTLAKTNAYTGGTTVSAGTLLLSGAFNMPTAGTLAVSSGGTFSLADGTALATTGASSGVGLTLATGSTMAFDWNGVTLDSFTLTGTATATSTGSVGIIINNTSPTGSGGTLITATGASTLNTASYFLANNTNYAATISKTATTVSIGAQSAVAALTDAYWKRNQVTGATDTMAYSLGTLSNWASDAAGTSAGGVVPGGSAVNVIFGATSASSSVTVGADMNLGSITFNDTAAVTIAGSNIITLNSTSGTAASTLGALQTVTAGSAISVTSFANATNTISANLALGANQTWNVASGKTLVVSGQVAGGFGLTKDDTGTLTLSGANTFTGGTTISTGTVKVGNATGLSVNSSAVSVTSGAVLDINGITMTGTNALTLNGSGIGGTGALLNSSSTAARYNGPITLASASTIGNTTAAVFTLGSSGNNINTNGFLLTFKGTGTINITGNGWGITGGGGVTVDGIYLDLRGGGIASTNPYTGTTTVQNGGAILYSGNNIGTGNINLNGGTIEGYFNEGFTRPFGTGSGQFQITGGVSGFGVNGGHTVDFSNVTSVQWGSASFNPSQFVLGGGVNNGTTTFVENIDLNNAIRTVTTDVGGVLSGVISTSTGTAGLIKEGAGTLTLTNAANTYNGDTTVSGGILRIGTGGRLGSGTYAGIIDIASTATFDYNSTANQILNGAITGDGILLKSSTSILTLGNTGNTYTGGTNLTAGILFAPTTTVMPSNYLTAGKVAFNGGTLAIRTGAGNDWDFSEWDALRTAATKNGGGLGLDTSNSDLVQSTFFGTAFSNTYLGGASFNLAKLGTNTLTLDQNNSFTGGLRIVQGTVLLNHANGLFGTNGSANAVTFDTGNTGKLTLNGNSLIVSSLNGASATHTVENANATPASLTIGNSANAPSTFAGVLQNGTGGGALSLIKAGTNTLTLSGATNTSTGGITINAGTLVYTADTNLGASGTRNLTFGGSATLTGFDGSSLGSITVNSGTASITAANYTFTSASGAGAIHFNTAGSSKNINLGNADAFTGDLRLRYLGNYNNLGNVLVQFSDLGDAVGSKLQIESGQSDSNQGGAIALSGNVGPLIFNNRQIQILARTASNNILRDNIFANNNPSAANTWVINTNLSYLENYAGTRNFILSGSNTGANAFNGVISNFSGSSLVAFAKTGAGTWILGGSNTYTGATTITTGTLSISAIDVVANANPLGQSSAVAGNLLLANGTTLRYTGSGGSTDRGFTLNMGTAGHSATLDASGTGAVNWTSTATPAYGTTAQTRTLNLTGTNTGNNTLAANIANNGGSAVTVTKSGAGTWVLSGTTSAYTGGTNVNGGVLMWSGAANLPTTGTLAVGAAGNFSLADGTVRNTTTAALTLASGSLLSFDWDNGAVDNLAPTAAITPGAISVGIIISPIGSPSGGPLNLLTGIAGSTLNSPNYFLANNTNFTATLTKPGAGAGSVTIGSYATATALTDNAYWKGGLTNAVGTMAFSSGTSSNWFSSAAGASANGVVPGGSAVNVIFGATGASNQSAVTTGANMNLGSITFNDTAAVTIAGSHTITLNNTSGTAATTTAALDTITNAGSNTNSAISVTSFASATNAITANLALGASQTWNVASGKTLTVSGGVSGPFGLTKADTGTLVLSGANIAYSGATAVNAGTLRLTSASSVSLSGAITVNAASTLALNGTNWSLIPVINLNGGTLLTDENGGFVITQGAVNVTLDSTLQTSGTGTTTNLSQLFLDGGLNIASTKTLTYNPLNLNSGLMVRNNASSSGSLVISGIGTGSLTGRANLQFSTAGASNFANTDLTLTNATMNIGVGTNGDANTAGATIKSLNGNGRVWTDTTSNTLTVGANNGTGSFSGVLANGTATLSLTKTGTGTQILSGANTYTGGTTITTGTLAVNGSLANTTTTIQTGATLQGSGTIGGSVTIQTGGTLAPGNSIESLGVASVDFLAGSTYAYELNSSAIDGDLTYSTGTLDITNGVGPLGTTLTLTELFSGTLAVNDKLTLISYTGGWTSGELFNYLGSTLADDSTFTLGANQWLFNYNDTTGGSNFTADQSGAVNYVTMTVIPEPNVAALLGGLGVLALLRRRR